MEVFSKRTFQSLVWCGSTVRPVGISARQGPGTNQFYHTIIFLSLETPGGKKRGDVVGRLVQPRTMLSWDKLSQKIYDRGLMTAGSGKLYNADS